MHITTRPEEAVPPVKTCAEDLRNKTMETARGQRPILRTEETESTTTMSTILLPKMHIRTTEVAIETLHLHPAETIKATLLQAETGEDNIRIFIR